MVLTESEKALLTERGYDSEDIEQIQRATSSRNTHYTMMGVDGEKKEISREEAIEALGRETYLSGIARSAFHRSAARTSDTCQLVYFLTDWGKKN